MKKRGEMGRREEDWRKEGKENCQSLRQTSPGNLDVQIVLLLLHAVDDVRRDS